MFEEVGKLNFPYTDCTPGEFNYLKKSHPMLVQKLGLYLRVGPEKVDDSLPIAFVFHGTERQRQFWLRNKDIDPKHVKLITDPSRLQGLRARVIEVNIDHCWSPMGFDERIGTEYSKWYISDLRSRYGNLWDVCRFLHPEDQKRWVRLA